MLSTFRVMRLEIYSTASISITQDVPCGGYLQGRFANPKIQKLLKFCVHIEEFIRNTNIFFVRAQFQFKGVKHPFEKIGFFLSKRISSKL